jgi:hypothetical protein
VALIRHAGRVVTRRKLEADAARPRLLTTEPGAGYRLREDEQPVQG